VYNIYFSFAVERAAKKEKKMKKFVSLILALTMVCAVLCSCGDGSKNPGEWNKGYEERKLNNEIVVGIGQDLEDCLDPHQSSSAGTREVFFNIYEG
jgi:peptide/nickel transport system substrate-binding protein